jgi:hypothetical protein
LVTMGASWELDQMLLGLQNFLQCQNTTDHCRSMVTFHHPRWRVADGKFLGALSRELMALQKLTQSMGASCVWGMLGDGLLGWFSEGAQRKSAQEQVEGKAGDESVSAWHFAR